MRTPLGAIIGTVNRNAINGKLKSGAITTERMTGQHNDCNCVQQWKTCEIVMDKEMYTISVCT
jgi:hypothetical protein